MPDISNFPWANASILEVRNIEVTDTRSFGINKLGRGLHRYEWIFTTIEMDDANDKGRMFKAIMSRAIDDFDYLTYRHKDYSYTRGTEPEEGIESNNDYPVGTKNLSFRSSGEWQLKSGDYINLFGHTKVYEVAFDTDLASGVQDVYLTFGLKKPVSQGEAVIVNDVTWTFETDTELSWEIVAHEGQDFYFEQKLVEKKA